jgi:hypothetical protein
VIVRGSRRVRACVCAYAHDGPIQNPANHRPKGSTEPTSTRALRVRACGCNQDAHLTRQTDLSCASACVRACVRACAPRVRACVCACACVRACVCACVCVQKRERERQATSRTSNNSRSFATIIELMCVRVCVRVRMRARVCDINLESLNGFGRDAISRLKSVFICVRVRTDSACACRACVITPL